MRRREKHGAKGPPPGLGSKSKIEVLEGKMPPEAIRRKAILVHELLDDAACARLLGRGQVAVAARKCCGRGAVKFGFGLGV